MGKINLGKVILGGIVAGVVMNVSDFVINTYIMKSSFDAVMIARNIPPDLMMNTRTIVKMVALDFAMALTLIFTYAAIRPRFGAGPKTAIIAGLIMVVATSVLAAYFETMGFFPRDVWVKASTLEAVNMLISAVAGAAVYNE